MNKKLTLTENVFEVYSEKYFNLINEVRELYENNLIRLCEEDISIIETDSMRYKATERYATGWHDARNIFGTQGV